MTNILKSFDLPVTVPSVVRAHYKARAAHVQAVGRDKLECESFMHYQLRLVKDLTANAQNVGYRPALETASLNRRLRARDFDDIAAILNDLFTQGLMAESELMRALKEAYTVRESLFGQGDQQVIHQSFYHRHSR
jgi:hypothetical protein